MIQNVIIFIISYLIGAFAFSQIIGSLQNIKLRGAKMTAITLLIWVIILIITSFVIYTKFNSSLIAYVVAMIISLLLVLSSGKIE